MAVRTHQPSNLVVHSILIQYNFINCLFPIRPTLLLGPTKHINRQPCNHTRATSTNRSGALLLHLCEDNGLAPNGLAPKTISPYSDVIIPVWFITFHLCSICSRGAKCCIHKLWFLWPKAGSPSAACRLSWFSSTN